MACLQTVSVKVRWLLGTWFALCMFRDTVYSALENSTNVSSTRPSVSIFYYLLHNWGDRITDGDQNCADTSCDWWQSDNIHHLQRKYQIILQNSSVENHVTTVAVYNAHSLWAKFASRVPLNCAWRTNLTMAISEESSVRYHHLFNSTFPNFDGYSTNSPHSSVQRIHLRAYLQRADFREEMYNFSYLIKAASYGKYRLTTNCIFSRYCLKINPCMETNHCAQRKLPHSKVARDCHQRDSANANRDGVIRDIRQAGFRVEGILCLSLQTHIRM